MNTLRFVLGDQLSRGLSALKDVDRTRDVVLMAEVHDEATHVRHHKQKIVLVLSAMRHLAQSLREEGLRVDYVQLGDPGNTGSLTGELGRALARHAVDRVVVTEPGEWRVWEMMQSWRRAWGVPVEIRTGNFALLAGICPAEVEAWYLIVYADAFEWVELPNTHGMALYADGGVLGSKPYAASAAYINRMSDYCAGCAYSPRLKSGPQACPLNYLYWHFLIVHEDKLKLNPHMALSYPTLARMTQERRQEIVQEAEAFLAQACGSPTEGRMPVTWQSTVPKEN